MTDDTNDPSVREDNQQAGPDSSSSEVHHREATGDSVLAKGLKLFGELAFAPGTSLLVDGNIKSGIAHVGAGLIARQVLGLPGLLAVGANSYSHSVTGKSLIAHAIELSGSKEDSIPTRIQEALDQGKPLDEILAKLAEDAEDFYYELTNKIS